MKTLLVYYSYTGNTKIIVDIIKEKVDCDVVELKPKTPFLEEDYQAIVDKYQSNESSKECVEIEDINVDLSNYNKVIIGTPVWWYTITPVLREFLKNNDLSQKQVYAFATNAGWLGRTFKEIESYCDVKKELNVQFAEDYREHKCLTSNDEINKWIDLIKE
ncbi:MAG: NAD(P)H-dependent oxidoreductase [Clostridia bacterium]|nr:NAD(P)H-dependent oxidoreductase [Clostridia bacterium]